MAPRQRGKNPKRKSTMDQVITRECTIHMAKRLHKVVGHRLADRAIRVIRKFAAQAMGTKDVRIDTRLNKQIWSRGLVHVPKRFRIRMARKRNEDDDATEKLYTYVTYVPVVSHKGLRTVTVDSE